VAEYRAGWICEEHPEQPFPHADCSGPDTQCRNPKCPWWKGTSPASSEYRRLERQDAASAGSTEAVELISGESILARAIA
jgi:hypothetical protein